MSRWPAPGPTRTLILRRLKGLEEIVPVSVVHWHMAENGWEFGNGEQCTGDRLGGRRFLHQLYTDAQADYSGAGDRPGPLGHADPHRRQQRVGRDRPACSTAPSIAGARPAWTSTRRR